MSESWNILRIGQQRRLAWGDRLDFWELLKVATRRWYVTIPILVVSLLTAIQLPAYINPIYSAQSTLILSLPADSNNDSERSRAPFNPFRQIPLPSLALSLGTNVEGANTRQEAVASGLSDLYTVSRESSSSPLIFVRAEGSTPEIAVETTEFVAERIQQELRLQQQAVGVADEDLIEALDVIPVVEAGAQVQNQRRLQVLALGVGIVVAVLSAAGVEGWARRREGKRSTSLDVKLEDRDALQRERLALLQERQRLLIAQQRLLDEHLAGSMVISRPDRDNDTPPEDPVTEPTSDGGRKRTEDRSGELRGDTVRPPDRMDGNHSTRTGWPAAPHISGRLLETS